MFWGVPCPFIPVALFSLKYKSSSYWLLSSSSGPIDLADRIQNTEYEMQYILWNAIQNMKCNTEYEMQHRVWNATQNTKCQVHNTDYCIHNTIGINAKHIIRQAGCRRKGRGTMLFYLFIYFNCACNTKYGKDNA